MVQGYYTLPEAAKFLSMSVDELKQMAQKGQIRSFQDRGTLRFRIQDIQELARLRGASTDPELVLGDASLPPPKSSATPPSGARKSHSSPKTPAKQQAASVPEVFDFDFDEDKVDIGADLPTSAGSGTKSKPGSKGSKKAPRTPPQAGSDSDVRLVSDGSDVTFSIPKESAPKPPDSDVTISPDPVMPKSGLKRPSQLALGSGAKAKPGSSATKPVSPRPELPPDSGVRLVGLDSDSDVKLVGASDDVPLGLGDSTATDSNVRLDRIELPAADSDESNLMLTDEIDLDAEMQKLDKLKKSDPPTKLKPKSELKLPAGSPFELSDSELDVPSELKGDAGPKTPRMAKKDDSSDYELAAQSPTDGSSDFDLVSADDGSILLEGSDSNDFSLAPGDDHEQVLEDRADTELTSSSSGISLNNPVDAGISLEEGAAESGDSLDFDLSLEPEDTPKPAASRPIDESSSEFELPAHKTPKPKKAQPGDSDESEEFDLSLDADADSDGDAAALQDSGDSNFELNLEGSDEGEASDSSEFELTLDDSGNLAAVEDDEAAPQVKSKKKGGDAEEQDIFETDFEVPALDDSDDATVADSELESSDFDLALDDSELAAEDESGSQVVALDEEDAGALPESDDDAAVADDVQVEEESSDFADMDEDVQVDEDDAVDVDVDEETATAGAGRTVIKRELIQPAPWGVVPVIFMLPCVIVMVLVGILGYEMVQSSANLKPPGPLTVELAKMLGQEVTLKKP